MKGPLACSLLLVLLLCPLVGPGARAEDPAPAPSLEAVARSEGRQWTGVAVSRAGRVFVNYPRWLGPHEASVAEIGADGAARPFPDGTWDGWTPGSDLAPGSHWICVQSVTCDAKDRLWILDAASPSFGGVVPGGAKLVAIDLTATAPTAPRVILFDETVAPRASYLNDVRVDVDRGVAFLTDSGLGAIVVVDLGTGRARRLLADHPSTKADPAVLPKVGGGSSGGPPPTGRRARRSGSTPTGSRSTRRMGGSTGRP